MSEFIFREATLNDIPFLVDTIIEAEKSGTDILSYTTVFGLTASETKEYLAQMLAEEIDGCELSVSSFLIAESDGHLAASVGAWIEGFNGIPSNVLKGNLLNFVLPKRCLVQASGLNHIIRDLHIEYIPNTIQIGLVYVASAYRGMNLVSLLIDKQISKYLNANHTLSEAYVQVFGNNLPAIRAYEKANFKIHLIKESSGMEVLNYLPAGKKILMKREI